MTQPDNYLIPNEPVRFTPEQMDRLLAYCVSLNASDITIQTGAPVYAEVYGRLLAITKRKLPNAEVGEILNTIYGPNGATQILSGRDIDTHYEFRPSRSQRFRYRVNGSGCMVEGHDGIQLTFRSIPTTPPPLSDLDLPSEIVDAIAPQEGIVFVTGATGSGKSTLLAAIIRDLIEQEDSNRKVLTYEAPIEFVFDEIKTTSSIVSQAEIPRHLPSFAAGIRNALRRKPRLIMVGECRDSETISAALEASLTGHPVYTTLHTSGVTETLRRLIASFPGEDQQSRIIDIIETIRLCIWQKLVPSVDGKRVALREYLVFDESIRDYLLDQPFNKINQAIRQLLKERGQPIAVDAKRKFEQGIISERDYKIVCAGSV